MAISVTLIGKWGFFCVDNCVSFFPLLLVINRNLVKNLRNKNTDNWIKFSSGLILNCVFIALWIAGFWWELLRVVYFNEERFEKQLQVSIPQTLQGQGKKPGG